MIVVILPDLSQPDKVITSFGFQNRLKVRTLNVPTPPALPNETSNLPILQLR